MAQPAKRVIINGISYDSSLESLSEFFSQFGEVTDALLPVDKDTGKIKGFGFVTFVDGRDALKVLDDEIVLEFDGRRVRCQIAKGEPRRQRKSRTPIKADHNKLYVGNVPTVCDAVDLREVFDSFGKITGAYMAEAGRSASAGAPHKGFGFVEFETLEETSNAVNFYPHVLEGVTLRVSVARPLPEGDSRRRNAGKRRGGSGKESGGESNNSSKSGSRKSGADNNNEQKKKNSDQKTETAKPEEKKAKTEAEKSGPPKKMTKLDREVAAMLRGDVAAKKKVVIAPAPSTSPWGRKAVQDEQVDSAQFPTLGQVISGEVVDTPKVVAVKGKGKGEEDPVSSDEEGDEQTLTQVAAAVVSTETESVVPVVVEDEGVVSSDTTDPIVVAE